MPRRPASRAARLDVAYRTGRAGGEEPDWMGDDDELHDSYAEGRREHDDEATEQRRRAAKRARPRTTRTRARKTTEAPTESSDDDSGQSSDEGPEERPAARSFDRKLFEPGDGGGLLLGALLYALGVAYLNEGAYGLQRWASAKFLNHVLPPRNARTARRTQPGRRAAA